MGLIYRKGRNMFGLLRRKPKNGKSIIINDETLETRAAVLDNGMLEDYKVERPSEERIVGSIFKGIVQNLEDSLHAAFVDIGLRKNAFIHYWDMFPEDLARIEAIEGDLGGRPVSRRKAVTKEQVAKLYPPGTPIIVQVTKGPIGNKGPRVTVNLSVPSRFFVLMPGSNLRGISRKIEDDRERVRLKRILARLEIPEGNGIIIRTAGAGAAGRSFVRDMRSLIETWSAIRDGIANATPPCCIYREPDLIERIVRDSVTEDIDSIVIDSEDGYKRILELVSRIARRFKGKIKLYEGHVPVFQHFEVQRRLEAAFRRKVALKSGGYLIIDETEALIAIDVNTGQHKGASSQDEAILEVNLEAVAEISRQMRLRNMGGLIVIDMIDMRQRKHRNMVYQAMKDAFRNDKARTNIMPVSALGLIEMTRQRSDESVQSQMFIDCPYCNGRGSVKSAMTMSIEMQRHLAEIMRKNAGKPKTLRVILNPSVLERLREEDEDILVELQAKYNSRLSFRADPARHIEEFAIQDSESGADIYVHTPQKQE